MNQTPVEAIRNQCIVLRIAAVSCSPTSFRRYQITLHCSIGSQPGVRTSPRCTARYCYSSSVRPSSAGIVSKRLCISSIFSTVWYGHHCSFPTLRGVTKFKRERPVTQVDMVVSFKIFGLIPENT